MPTVAILDEEGLLRGVEEVSDEVAERLTPNRVRVPPGIDLPMDGSYWWDKDAKTFLALSQVAALQLSKAPVPIEYVTFLWLQSVLRGTPLPGEVQEYVEWYEEALKNGEVPHERLLTQRAVGGALRALVRGEPMPDVVRQYVEWYDRHERERAENRTVRTKQLLRAPRR